MFTRSPLNAPSVLQSDLQMALADQRAANVFSGLRNRIVTLLDGGATVSLRRKNLVLRDVVLTRADGTETPAAAEVRLQVERRGLDPASFSLDRWDRTAAVWRQDIRIRSRRHSPDGHKATKRTARRHRGWPSFLSGRASHAVDLPGSYCQQTRKR